MSKLLLGALALLLAFGGTGCLPGALGDGNSDDDASPSPPPPGCTGTVSGALTGTIEHCSQTVVTDTSSGEVTHGFVGLVGDQQVTIVFDFASEPPAPGSYDSTSLPNYQASIGLLAWSASWDARYDDVPEGTFRLDLAGGHGSELEGSIVATCVPLLAGESSGNVELSVTFP